MRITTLAILISSLMACAARSGGGGPGSGSNTPDAPAQENAVSIKSIRMTQPTNGTMITLQNVVVTGHVSVKSRTRRVTPPATSDSRRTELNSRS